MTNKTKALLGNLLGFAIIYFPAKYILTSYIANQGIMRSLLAFGISLVLAPKFYAMSKPTGEKLFMKWIFLKGMKEL